MTTSPDAPATGGAPPGPAALLTRLVCEDAVAAIAFYERALGAEVVERHDGADGAVQHAVLAVAGTTFAVKSAGGPDPSPTSLGGTPVVLMLEVDDVDPWAHRFAAAGGEVVYAVDDRHEYGRRDGRFRDPAGHLWLLSAPLRGDA